MNRRNGILVVLCFLSALFSACSRGSGGQERVATVNDAPLFLKDFEEEVSLAARRDPNVRINPQTLENLLQTDIDRKLMIQEAVKRGLSQDERFVRTIKKFWEQTLIRELIDAKTKEWENKFFATDDEVKMYYEGMRWKITVRAASRAAGKEAEEAKEKMLRGEAVEGEAVMGPLLLENVRLTDPLYNAFGLSNGDGGVWKGRGGYLAVRVVKKEPVNLPELRDIYGQISKSLIEQKKERALDIWMDTLRKSSKIEINRENLKRVANE
ncbi:MAG: hypothetical protein HY883_02625 [Deltaproteobacteria bacterium]|nr:hypothetical protein [Deltaproteobacteria bacterium]